MKKQRKHYTPEEKVAILRRHLVEGVQISDLCDERGLQPTVFYRWQKEFFENGAAAFQQKGNMRSHSGPLSRPCSCWFFSQRSLAARLSSHLSALKAQPAAPYSNFRTSTNGEEPDLTDLVCDDPVVPAVRTSVVGCDSSDGVFLRYNDAGLESKTGKPSKARAFSDWSGYRPYTESRGFSLRTKMLSSVGMASHSMAIVVTG
jgi:hypothetical protein